MKLTSHYVPFLKSAPPKTLRVLGLSALLTALACTGTAGARATETAPPLPGGVHCTQSVKRTYSLTAVISGGMPVKVSCDGPARVQVIFDFYAMTPQSRELPHLFGHSIPDNCRSHDVALPHAGSIVLRPELMPYGARIARHHRRTKLIVHFLSLREDGFYWSEGLLDRHTYLVRSGSQR
jgi:hypothetical protein